MIQRKRAGSGRHCPDVGGQRGTDSRQAEGAEQHAGGSGEREEEAWGWR